MKYNKRYFIDYLSPIPSSRWITRKLADGEGKGCVMGWLGVGDLPVDGDKHYPEKMTVRAMAFAQLFKKTWNEGYVHIVCINNYQSNGFDQDTPKARVMAALEALPDDHTPLQAIISVTVKNITPIVSAGKKVIQFKTGTLTLVSFVAMLAPFFFIR